MVVAELLRPLAATGLSLGLRNGRRSASLALGLGGAMGLVMALADATVFRAVVPAIQHTMLVQWTLAQRFALFLPGALMDELVLRLGGLTLLMALAVAAGLKRSPPIDIVIALLVACVLWPVWASAYLGSLALGGPVLAREILLHVGAGTLWGWLYCRHGWLAGVIGHGSAHLVLQPLLGFIG